jgi:peptide/nickel transport system substrate-binding protein
MKIRFMKPIYLCFLLVFILSGCVSAAQTPVPTEAQPAVQPTEAPVEQPTEPPAEPPTEQPAEPPTEPPAAEEAILRIGWASEPDTMNPLTTYSTEAMEVIALVYDKLLDYDLSFKTIPSLAEEYSYSEDGLTLTFKLREGVKWHDGEPFSAEDVAFTYNLVKDSNLGLFAQWLKHVTSATASDSNTFVLTFDLPQSVNPGLAVPILPKHIWSTMSAEEIEAFPNDTPIGTGPFRFVEWKVGSQLTLERNPDFWRELPAATKVVYVLYGNEDVMAQALKSGDIDVITEVPPTIWDGLASTENIKALSIPSFSFHQIAFNMGEGPNNPLLRDKAIRQALSYALDRNQLVQVALAGHGQPGDTIVPIGLTAWHLTIPPDKQMNADPEKAKQILDEAGYVDNNGDGVREDSAGNPLQFRLIAIETTTVDVRAAQLFRDAAAAVGIQLDIQTLDENTLGELVYNFDNPDWDIHVWGWDLNIPDPNDLISAFTCDQIGGNNEVYFCNQRYDELFNNESVTLDYEARKAMIDEMQTIFYEDSPYLVMWYQDKLQAYRTDTWTGWTEAPGGIIYNMTRENYLLIQPVQ